MRKVIEILLWIYLLFFIGLFFTNYSFLSPSFSVSNIVAPTIIGLVLLLVFRDSGIFRSIQKLAQLSDKSLILFFCVAVFLLITPVSLARHFSFGTAQYDLGIFDQAVWNASRGNGLLCTVKNNSPMNLLGDHFEPILFLIAPLYWIWPGASTLIILQSLVLASAVVPLFLIARTKLGNNRWLIIAFLISYALSKPLRGIAYSDFHPDCFILLALFWAYYFLIKKNNAGFWISLVALIACKEDTAFLIVAFGLFAFFGEKRRTLGVCLMGLGVSLWFFLSGYLIPSLNPAAKYDYLSKLPFGPTYADNLSALIGKPQLMITHFFTKLKLEYVLGLLGPLLFLPMLSSAHIFLFAVPLLKTLLPGPALCGIYDISSHYTAHILPLIIIAAIEACRRFKMKWLAVVLIAAAFLSHGKTDGHKLSRFMKTIRTEHTLQTIQFLNRVPVEASVAAGYLVVPHLSARHEMYLWTPDWTESSPADYLVIDKNPRLIEYLTPEQRAGLEKYLQAAPAHGYETYFSANEGDFLILRKST